MSKSEQRRIIRELCANLKATMLDKVKNIPDDWTGRELRNYMADKASEQFRFDLGSGAKKYKNDMLIRNL